MRICVSSRCVWDHSTADPQVASAVLLCSLMLVAVLLHVDLMFISICKFKSMDIEIKID